MHTIVRYFGGAVAALVLAGRAEALVIAPSFGTSITGDANAAAIEAAINDAAQTIGSQFSNPVTIPVLFQMQSGSFLGESNTADDILGYGNYTARLASDALANPANTVLAEALNYLSVGNDGSLAASGNTGGVNGSRPIATTLAQAAVLGVSGVSGCFDASGNFVGGCNAPYYGVITLSSTEPLDYTQPLPSYNGSNLEYDATRVVEHEIDEILGIGGQGSMLNEIDAVGLNNPNDIFTQSDGAVDLYRYSGIDMPSFSTASNVNSYFSVDGGATAIATFNQNSSGDYGDLGPTSFSCGGAGGLGGPSGLIQDAFTCYNQTGETFGPNSPEYTMLESIGYDPAAIPEPATLGLFGTAIVALGLARRRRGRA